MATVNLFESDPMSEILANAGQQQAQAPDDRTFDAGTFGNISQGTYDGILNSTDISRLIETGQITNSQAMEIAQSKGIVVPGLANHLNFDDPAVDVTGRTAAPAPVESPPAPVEDLDSYSVVSAADIDRLIASGKITTAQAVQIAEANRIFVPSIADKLDFVETVEGVRERGYDAIDAYDDNKEAMSERTRLEQEAQANQLEAEEEAQEKAEAEEAAVAAEDDDEEAEQLQEDLVTMFGMDDGYSPAGRGWDYGYEFSGFDDFDAYLEDELLDDDYFDEEWAEMEMQYGMDIDGDGLIGSIDGVDFYTEDMSAEGAEVEGEAVEGDEIGDPELEKSALTGPELDGPSLGDEMDGEGQQEGLEADGAAKGEGIDAEGVGEMQVGELQADGSERDGAGLEAGEMEVGALEDIELDAPDVEAPVVLPVAAQPNLEQKLNEETALDTVYRKTAAEGVELVDAKRDEITAAQSIDVAGPQVAVGAPTASMQTATPEQSVAASTEPAPPAATPEPEAPAKTEPSAGKTLGLPVKFGEMEPWVKELSSQFQGMVDPAKFVNLAASNISPTGKVPPEHGSGMSYNPSLPNLGGAQQLAV